MRRAARPWAGYLLGFALGGFFDGILLHQILQWHHLLSALQGGRFGSLRVQLLADGLFHLLMYAVALCGLWSLWRSRQRRAAHHDKDIVADGLVGFGAWHIVDAVLSHWILGLHRIRMDSANPLAWDLLWFGVFGIVMLAWGLALRRGGPPVRPPAQGRGAIAMVLAVLLAAPVAALPVRGARQVVVLVPPSGVNRMLDGLASVGGGILWSDRSGAVWVLSVEPGAAAGRLYEHGAWLVSRSPAALGCLAWAR